MGALQMYIDDDDDDKREERQKGEGGKGEERLRHGCRGDGRPCTTLKRHVILTFSRTSQQSPHATVNPSAPSA